MVPTDNPLIITAAITGSALPRRSAALPLTPDEIIDSAVEASDAGAAIVHIHARDPVSGRPTSDIKLFEYIICGISERCTAIIQPTTSGKPDQSVTQRGLVVSQLRPEMASFNSGSINSGSFRLYEDLRDLEPWEVEYVESSRNGILKNTFTDMEAFCQLLKEANTKPEFEAYDTGHLHNIHYLAQRGLASPPIYIQFIMGMAGGIGATTSDLLHMLHTATQLLGEDYCFSAAGLGYPAQTEIATQAIIHGGHVRTGLEDNSWLSTQREAQRNSDLVAKVVSLAAEFDRRPATPEEARSILGLAPRGVVLR